MIGGFEYRVRWQREGRRPVTAIYQTEMGARDKAKRMLELEELKGTDELFAQFGDMPDLVGDIVVERRTIGDWEPVT